MIYRLLLILIVLIVQNEILVSQEIHLTNYTASDGLSQNSVHTSVITKEGYIWLGTEDGINRFDGKNIKRIYPVKKDIKTIVAKYISFLFCDAQDFMWVASASGIVIYDRHNNTLYDPANIYPGCSLLEDSWIVNILQDKNNNLWFHTNNQSLYKYEMNSKKTIKIMDNSLCQGIALNQKKEIIIGSGSSFYKIKDSIITPLVSLSKDITILDFRVVGEEIWMLTNKKKIFIIRKNKIVEFKKLYFGENFLIDPRIIYENSNGLVWIGSRSGGLCKVNIKEKTYKIILPSENKHALASPFILSIYGNGYQTIIGQSGGGFAIIDDHISGITSYKSIDKINNKIQDNMIFSLFKLNNDMYSGTLYGGLLKTNLSTGKFVYYIPPINDKISPESRNIYTIIKEKNHLWMASWGGILKYNLESKKFMLYGDEKDKKSVRLTSLIKLKDKNNFLVGGYNGGLLLFDLNSNKFSPCFDPQNFQATQNFRPRYMKEMNNGNIYISSEENSFFKYNINSGIFTSYTQIKKFSGTSRHFYFHKDKCFIATDDGLLMTDTVTFKILKIFTTKNGLPNNYIYSIQVDENDKLWASSNAGIAFINLKNFSIIPLFDNHGLQGLEFNTASVENDSEGNMYFGGTSGFSKITPSKINFSTPDFPPAINEIRIMNKPIVSLKDVSYLDTVVTQYNKNLITLRFQTINENLQRYATYRYKMEDVDEDWNLISNQNYVNYSNLKPGKYKFSVQSFNNDGSWSKIKILTIIVQPAWFQTWFFRIAVIILSSLCVYLIVKWRLSQIKEKATIEKDFLLKIKSLEMDNLRSQMNPHFMFNAMNSINKFIIEKNTNLASDYLTKFSRLMRMILEYSKKPLISIQNELEALQIYLHIEITRFEYKFQYEINIEEDVDETSISIPPFIIQPFVENAIWHGLLQDKSNGMININIYSAEISKLVIEVKDNGIGRKKAEELKSKSSENKKSYGMTITKERILNAHLENQVIITDLYNDRNEAEGTLVKIILKI